MWSENQRTKLGGFYPKIKVYYISALLICATLITSIIPSIEVHGSIGEYDCHIITLENNACLKMKETDSGRFEYYTID